MSLEVKMANLGVNQKDVNIAASELFREGKPVTITTVRERIGSGSFSTVSKYLANWKVDQGKQENIPPISELYQKQMSEIWALVHSEIEKTFEEKRLEMEKEKIKWEEEKKSFLHEIEKLEIENSAKTDQLKKAEDQLKAEKEEYEKRLANSFKVELQIPMLQEKIASLEIRLEEAGKRAERFEFQLIEIAKGKTKGE